MTLETLIADAVERGVLAAMTRIHAAHAAPEPAVEPKKPGRPRKTEIAARTDAVVTEAPLPPPAPAPAVAMDAAKTDDLETDRARLLALTTRIPDGRKVATELIRQHGPKFDGLPAEARALVISTLEQQALPAEVV